jgi:predicted N-formylglutamate amidohydrolase
MQPLLHPNDPEPVEIRRVDGKSPLFLTCEHAGRSIPLALGTLGLESSELDRHIAWDIGAGAVTRRLSDKLDAAAVLQRYSRLVVDCNRSPEAEDFIATISETTPIAANRIVNPREAEARRREVFQPFHDAVSGLLDAREEAGRISVLVSVHSCTPVYHGVYRPWHIGVLYDKDERFARILLDLLDRHGELTVGENEPYFLDHRRDYSVPVHGEQRGLPHVELEIRQDLVTDVDGQRRWADILAAVLTEGLGGLGIPAS